MEFTNMHILDFIVRHGYAAVAALLAGGVIGLPVPDELLMLMTGYLVSIGRLHAVPAVLFSLIGSLTGITVSYLLGRFLGQSLVNAYGDRLGITPKRLQLVESWFERFGKITIPISYYIPGIRQLVAFFAAMSGMRYPQFAVYAYPGGLLWVSTFIGLGWFLAADYQRAMGFFHHYHSLALLLLTCGLILSIIYIRKLRTD